jgi:hypothetical protein
MVGVVALGALIFGRVLIIWSGLHLMKNLIQYNKEYNAIRSVNNIIFTSI